MCKYQNENENYFLILNEIIAKVAIINLPNRAMRTKSFENDIATVSGFGRDSDLASGISRVMRYVSQVIISNAECAKYYGLVILTQRNICISGDGGKSSCQVNIKHTILLIYILYSLITNLIRVTVVVHFNSLFLVKLPKLVLSVLEQLKVSHFLIKFKLYLIIFNLGCELGYPAAFTRVSMFLDWIQEKTGIVIV